MNAIPSAAWLNQYETKKDWMISPVNLNRYFTEKEIGGKKIALLSMGTLKVTSGKMIVRDPLAYLNKEDKPYWKTVPAGTFPLTACVVLNEEDCERYAAVKLDFTKEIPVRYEEALIGIEDLEDVTETGDYFGFSVDAGLATIADQETVIAYCNFREQWEKKNSAKNIYDHFFADLFDQSYKQNSQYQREGGDWINWTIPGTQFNIPMFQSGFGDGAYPVYFGIDAQGNISQLVVHFIDIELAYKQDI